MANATLSQKLVVELVGVFLFVFVGAGAVIASQFLSAGAVSLLIIALANGIGLAIAITFAMNISGGHINPAVTIAAFVAGKIKPLDAIYYIIVQVVGASIAGFMLVMLFPAVAGSAVHYGTPAVSGSITTLQAIALEAVMTFFLVFVVFGTAVDKRAPKVAGFAIGLTVMVDVLAGGALTGAAMNPARAIGPAIASLYFTNWYVYWIGPIVGAVVAALIYTYAVMEKK